MRPLQDPDAAVAGAVAGDSTDPGQRMGTTPIASSAVQPSTHVAVHTGSDAAHVLTASWTQQANASPGRNVAAGNRTATTKSSSFTVQAAVVDSNSHGDSSDSHNGYSNSYGDNSSSYGDDNNSHGRHSNSHGESKSIVSNSGADVGSSTASAVDSGSSGQARADLNSPAEQSIDPEVHRTVEMGHPTQHDKADAVASFELSRAAANLPTAQGRADASVGYTNSRLPRASLGLLHHSLPANSWALVRQLCLSCKMHACNVC